MIQATKALYKKFLDKQFVYFVAACGIAAGINFGSRIAFGAFMSYTDSIVLAYLLGMVCAFILCRCFVFKAKNNNVTKQFAGFCMVNVVGIFLTVSVSLLLANHLLLFVHHRFERLEIAHFIGMATPTVTSYIGHKYISFGS